MAYAGAWVYAEEWAIKLQEQLDEPNKFMDICDVRFTNMRVINNPYHADPTVTTLSRGTAYTYDSWAQTNQSLTINQARRATTFFDRADLAQSTFFDQMEAAKRQGILLNERLEAAVYGDHANFTNFGSGDITGGTVADSTTIIVSASNVDDVIRHVERVIIVANGQSVLNRNGGFIVWRPADFQNLRAFMQANGFAVADEALRAGATQGVNYMGFTHYSSNLLVANHVYAGVKKLHTLGVLRDTYGQIVVVDDPGDVSGIGVVSRVDYGLLVPNNYLPVLLDVNVA